MSLTTTLLTVSLCAFIGCGTWRVPSSEVLTSAQPTRFQETQASPRLVLLGIESDLKISELGQISSCTVPEDKAEEQRLINDLSSRAQTLLQGVLTHELEASQFRVVAADVRTVPASLLEDSDDELSPVALADLAQVKDADLLLRFRLTDYGSVPESVERFWIYGTVAWVGGVTAVAYASEASRKFIAGYLATEVLQESLGAYASFSVTDYFLKMVRIEGELIRVSDGKIVWSDSHIGTAWRWSVQGDESCGKSVRAEQLSLALERAVQKLTATLVGREA